jgi:glycosyltransferase involved in cell wall biosynthesis
MDDRIYYREAVTLSRKYDVTVIGTGDHDQIKFLQKIKLIYLGCPTRRILHLALLLRAFIALVREKPKVIQCHEPDTLVISRLVASLSRDKIRVVYDVHEHYPSLWSHRKYLPSAVRGLTALGIDLCERSLSKGVDAVLVVSESVGSRFCHVRSGAIAVLNYPWRSSYENLVDTPTGEPSASHPLVLYAGSVDEKRGILQFLMALKNVRESFPKVKFVVLGSLDVTQKLFSDMCSFLGRNRLEHNFQIKQWLPYFEYYRSLHEATVGVVLFQPTIFNNIVGLPNKLFDYMGAGVPVVASNFPEIRKIVKGSGCGFLVDATKPGEIAAAIVKLISDPELAASLGRRGHRAVMEHYNWESQEEKLLAAYERLCE